MSWRRALPLMLFGLLLAEVATRLALWVPAVQAAVFHRNGPASFRVAWLYDDLDAQLFSSWIEHDPQLGWRNAPSTSFNDAGLRRTVDAQGHRITPSSTGEPLHLFGDSFTFGDDAADRDTWPWQLGERRRDLRVVNHGVSGYGLDQAVLLAATATEGGHRVLAVNELLERRTDYDFYTYAKPTMKVVPGLPLRAMGQPIPSPTDLRARATAFPRLLDVAQMLAWQLAPPAELVRHRRARALLDRFVGDARAANAVPVLLVLPTPSDHGRRSLVVPWAATWCAEHPGVTCLNAVTPIRRAHANGVELLHRAHWTRAGHTLVADVVDAGLPASPDLD